VKETSFRAQTRAVFYDKQLGANPMKDLFLEFTSKVRVNCYEQNLLLGFYE